MNESILKNNNGKYFIENVLIEDIAQEFGTPSYVYMQIKVNIKKLTQNKIFTTENIQ